jgi:mono/diheme cytochrome c family protein
MSGTLRIDRECLRSLALALGLVASTSAAAAGAERGSVPDAEQAARGQVVYKRFCAVCHGKDGAGDGQLATELRAKPTDLTRLSAKNGDVFPFEKVVRAIDGRDTVRAHGSSDMPVWGEVFAKTEGTDTPDPVAAVDRLTHYVWSLQKPAGR